MSEFNPFNPTIAIVGRPNVGKSALFNRLVGRRISIVHDEPGVTRDRIAAPLKSDKFSATVVDTGGIGEGLEDGFAAQVTAEAEIAMQTAELILFVVNCQDGITPVDEELARKLRRAQSPILLVINKVDSPKHEELANDFASLGFGISMTTSAEHGYGFAGLYDRIDQHLLELAEARGLVCDRTEQLEEIEDDESEQEDAGPAEKDPNRHVLNLAIVGRPNVGKSSLVNAILKDQRSIVSDIAGTTRDSVDIPYQHGDQAYNLIDTAGLRQRQKMDTSVEVFSAMRSERSIRRADLCLLVIDVAAGVTAMDRKIASTIVSENKPCIIVLNKWDLFHPKETKDRRLELATEMARNELFFISYAPIITCSAIEGQYLNKIFAGVEKVRRESQKTLSTGVLNRLLAQAFDAQPPAQHKKLKKRLRLLYATAAVNERYGKIPVPTYILFVNDKRLMLESYQQYLANRIKQFHPQAGIPVVFSIRSRN